MTDSAINMMTAQELAGALKYAALKYKRDSRLVALLMHTAKIMSKSDYVPKAARVVISRESRAKMKIPAIKALREAKNLNLKDAKDEIESSQDVVLFEGSLEAAKEFYDSHRGTWRDVTLELI